MTIESQLSALTTATTELLQEVQTKKAVLDNAVTAVAEAVPVVMRNIGSSPTAPTVRSNGGALQTGDYYFNTVSNATFVYSGGTWGMVTGATAADLANATDPAKGAALIGYDRNTVAGRLERTLKLENAHCLRDFFKALYAFETVEDSSLAIACYGDSVSADVCSEIYKNLATLIGFRHATTFGSSQNNIGGVINYTGGSSFVDPAIGTPGNYTYLPTGSYFNAPASSNILFANNSQQNGFVKATLYYAKIPGGGTATVELLNENMSVAATQVVNTSNSVIDGGKVEFTGLDLTVKYRLRVTASVADVVVLGLTMFKPRGAAMLFWQRGGTTLDEQNTSPKSIFDFINLDHGVSLFVSECKGEEASTTGVTNMAARFSAIPASVILIGSRPDSSSVVSQKNASELFRNVAIANNYAFVDAYHMLRNYAELQRLGWGGDGTHLPVQTAAFISSLILRHLPIGILSKYYVTQDVKSGRVISREFAVENAVTDTVASRLPFATAVGGGAPNFVNIYNISQIRFGALGVGGAIGGYGAGCATFTNGSTFGTHTALGYNVSPGSTSISNFHQVRLASVLDLGEFTVAQLTPQRRGSVAFATDGRKVGEAAGAGTGVPVYCQGAGGQWRVMGTDAVVTV